MANWKHVDRLKEGATVWNPWRENHPEVLPDSYNADLSGVDLSHTKLDHAILSHVDLSHAKLSYTILSYVDLSGTDLRHVNGLRMILNREKVFGFDQVDTNGNKLWELSFSWGFDMYGCDMRGMDLSRTDMARFNLSGANRRWADLRKADLSGVDLSEAVCAWAVLQGANLKEVQVDSANFQGADLHGIPWMLVMDLTLQPKANFAGILWDHSTDEEGFSGPPL